MKKCLSRILIIILLSISFISTFEDFSSIQARAEEKAYITLITTKKAKVKSGPGNEYQTLGSIKKNKEIKVYGAANNDWFIIIYKNQIGYVERHQVAVKDSTVLGAKREASDKQTSQQESQPNSQQSTSQKEQKVSSKDSYAIAQDTLKAINSYRTSKGLPSLSWNNNLTSLANMRAEEISRSFSHTSPNGSSYNSTVLSSNIDFNTMGENIGFGCSTGKEMVDYWLTSSGHKSLIENPAFTSTAIGIYIANDGTIYFTQEFMG